MTERRTTTSTGKRNHEKMVNEKAQAHLDALLTVDESHKVVGEGVAASVKYFPRYLKVNKQGQRWAYYYRGDSKVSFKTVGSAQQYLLAQVKEGL